MVKVSSTSSFSNVDISISRYISVPGKKKSSIVCDLNMSCVFTKSPWLLKIRAI